MKPIKVKTKTNQLDLLKETPEVRRERVQREGNRFRPRIVKDKTKYDRNKFKSESNI